MQSLQETDTGAMQLSATTCILSVAPPYMSNRLWKTRPLGHSIRRFEGSQCKLPPFTIS